MALKIYKVVLTSVKNNPLDIKNNNNIPLSLFRLGLKFKQAYPISVIH